MNSKLNFILRTALSSSLQDREKFVDKVAGAIENATGQDADVAEKIGEELYNVLGTVEDNLFAGALAAIVKKDSAKKIGALEKKIGALEKKIDALTEMVQVLTDKITD